MPSGAPIRIINVDFSTVTVTDEHGNQFLAAPADAVAQDLLGGAGEAVDLGLLPPGLRFISPSQRSFLVEREAGTHIVLKPEGGFVELPFPHHFLAIHFATDLSRVVWVGCGFSSFPVYQLTDTLFPIFGAPDFEIPCPPLPTITNPVAAVNEILERVASFSFGRVLTDLNPATLPVEYLAQTTEPTTDDFLDWWSRAELHTEVRRWSPSGGDDVRQSINRLLGQDTTTFDPTQFPNSLELLLNVVDRHATIRNPMVRQGPRPKVRLRIKPVAEAPAEVTDAMEALRNAAAAQAPQAERAQYRAVAPRPLRGTYAGGPTFEDILLEEDVEGF